MELTVVIPIYNAEAYLERCLDSIIACQSGEMECILVNDGSTDNSASVCRIYQEKDQRIRIITKQNSGVSDSRNAGIKEAAGNYIMFLDADDYIDKSKWPVILSWAKEAAHDFISFGRNTEYSDGKRLEGQFTFEENSMENPLVLQKMMFADSVWNECWGKLFKREMIIQNQIEFKSGIKIGEDTRFVTDCFIASKTPVAVRQNILFYCQHAASAIHAISFEERFSYMEALYRYGKEKSALYGSQRLNEEVDNYYFRVITNLILVYGKKNTLTGLKKILEQVKANTVAAEILSYVQPSMLSSRKKVEFNLLSLKGSMAAAVYFKLKSYIYKG